MEYVIVVLIAVLGIAAILARGSAQIASARSGGRIVLHYPAPGAEPMALLSLTEHSVILDRTAAAAMKRRIDGAATESGDAEILSRIDAMTDIDLRVGAAVAGGLPAGKRPGIQLPLTVVYGGPEFDALVGKLKERDVPDAVVVAEALLANCDDGAVPTLVTTQHALRERLPRRAADAAGGSTAYRQTSASEPVETIAFEGRVLRVVTVGA